MRFQPSRTAAKGTPTFDEVAAVVRTSQAELAELGVTAIALFGSVARGDATPDSDVDLAVGNPATDNDSLDALAAAYLAGELLAERLGRQVDVAELPLPTPLARYAADDLRMICGTPSNKATPCAA